MKYKLGSKGYNLIIAWTNTTWIVASLFRRLRTTWAFLSVLGFSFWTTAGYGFVFKQPELGFFLDDELIAILQAIWVTIL